MGNTAEQMCEICGKVPRKKYGRFCPRCGAERVVDMMTEKQKIKNPKLYHKICKTCGTPFRGYAQTVNCRECRIKNQMEKREKENRKKAAESGWLAKKPRHGLPGTMAEIARLNQEAIDAGMSYGPYVARWGL